MMLPAHSKRSIELFGGAAGLGLGLARAGFHHEIIVEQDRAACDTIRYNQARGHALVQGWKILEADVEALDLSAVKEEPDLLSGGPPCQGWSIGGKHRGIHDERNLWPWVVEAVAKLRPRAFIFENVPALATSHADYFEYLKLALRLPALASPRADHLDDTRFLQHCVDQNTRSEPSYRISTQVLSAADFGVAQKRSRLFIVGLRDDVTGDYETPTATHCADELMTSKWITGEYWRRHGLQRPEMDDKAARFVRGHNQRSFGDLFAARLRPHATVRDAISDLGEPTETGTEAFPDHIKVAREARAYKGHNGSPIDQPSLTLRAGDHGVSGGENMVNYGDGTYRHFTTREAARLQAFPDDYLFPGTWSDNLKQLGNAVPTTLGQVVGEAVSRALN